MSLLQNITIEYFEIQGRAEPLRFFLEDAGIKYAEESNEVSFDANRLDCDKYAFNQLPVMRVDGMVLAQQDAILRYMAAATGRAGSGDLLEDTRVSMLALATEDLMSAYLKCIYSPDAPDLLTAFVQTQAPKVFRQFEHLLKKGSSEGYFVYAYPSFAEFHLLYNVENITTLRPDILAEFPLLAAWRKTMHARQGIEAYLASGRQKQMRNGSASGQKAIC